MSSDQLWTFALVCYKISYLTDFSTDWLTDYLMPSADKRNLITAKAMGSNSLTVQPSLSWDMPFYQPQELWFLYPGYTFVLCSLFLSTLLRMWWFVGVPLHGFMENLVTGMIAEVFIMLSFNILGYSYHAVM